MRITYDPEADAAYFCMAEKIHLPDTRKIDDDLYLDFGGDQRLLGVEVLAASERLDLDYLLPFLEIIGREEPGWQNLRVTLLRYKQAGSPVKTKVQGNNSWVVEEVAANHVSLRRELTGKVVTITRVDLENRDESWHKSKRRSAIVKALGELGGYE